MTIPVYLVFERYRQSEQRRMDYDHHKEQVNLYMMIAIKIGETAHDSIPSLIYNDSPPSAPPN